MIGVLLPNVFHAKIINHEGEGDRAPLVLPKTWRDFALMISMLFYSFFEQLLRNKACMLQSIHPAPDLNINIAIAVNFILELILLDNSVGECAIFRRRYV